MLLLILARELTEEGTVIYAALDNEQHNRALPGPQLGVPAGSHQTPIAAVQRSASHSAAISSLSPAAGREGHGHCTATWGWERTAKVTGAPMEESAASERQCAGLEGD